MAVAKSTEASEASVLGALRRLEAQAQDGDVSALKRIRGFLDNHPEVWKHLGDLTKLVERGWLELMGASSPLALESMVRTVAEMRKDLLGESPTRLETLLVDDIIASWLESRYGESLLTEDSTGLPVSIYRLKRMESAHKRYLSAIKMLQDVQAKLPKEQMSEQPVKQAGTQPVKKSAAAAAMPTAQTKKGKSAANLRIYDGERESA